MNEKLYNCSEFKFTKSGIGSIEIQENSNPPLVGFKHNIVRQACDQRFGNRGPTLRSFYKHCINTAHFL